MGVDRFDRWVYDAAIVGDSGLLCVDMGYEADARRKKSAASIG